MGNKRILLNCLPPTPDYKPGYSLSVIKSYLVEHGYHAPLKYWNLFLQNYIEDFWAGKREQIPMPWLFKDLMPFFAYYAVKRNDETVSQRIISLLKDFIGTDANEDYLRQKYQQLKQIVTEELRRIDIASYDYVYVQSKFYKYELISTGVFCDIVKEVAPNVITIIEAQEFPRKAMAMIDSFSCYDYATWGEYENSLISLLETLEQKKNIHSASNVVYRDVNGIAKCSFGASMSPIDLNTTPFADFTDYMEQSDIAVSDVIFPLESGRGCHWNKCSFCYMNDGYIYRKKTPDRMLAEIKHYIDRYGAEYFYFIDNDLPGHDMKNFKQFLHGLRQIRESKPLRFEFGEFIARDLNADVVRLIGEAGFNEIQIGYESTSDTALGLINKKSRFAHLILVSKWAQHYGIRMSYQNVLYSMPFENDSIILDNINNLYFLRFLLANKGFRHSLRDLCVVSTSRYYSQLLESGKLSDWDSTPMQEYMVANLIKPEYKYDVFLMGTQKFNPLWMLFKETERFYVENNYSYQIVKNNDNYEVIEFSNEQRVRATHISDNEHIILSACEREVKSLDYLSSLLPNQTQEGISNEIKKLSDAGLIYASKDLSQIVSLIILS